MKEIWRLLIRFKTKVVDVCVVCIIQHTFRAYAYTYGVDYMLLILTYWVCQNLFHQNKQIMVSRFFIKFYGGFRNQIFHKTIFYEKILLVIVCLITCLSVFGQLLNDGIYYLIIQNNEVEVWGPSS